MSLLPKIFKRIRTKWGVNKDINHICPPTLEFKFLKFVAKFYFQKNFPMKYILLCSLNTNQFHEFIYISSLDCLHFIILQTRSR